MAREYTKKELKQLRLLAEAEGEGEPVEIEASFSEEEIAQMILSSMGVGEEDGIEEEPQDLQSMLEQSYIARNLTGRGLMKIHGFTTPERIYW